MYFLAVVYEYQTHESKRNIGDTGGNAVDVWMNTWISKPLIENGILSESAENKIKVFILNVRRLVYITYKTETMAILDSSLGVGVIYWIFMLQFWVSDKCHFRRFRATLPTEAAILDRAQLSLGLRSGCTSRRFVFSLSSGLPWQRSSVHPFGYL